MTTRTPDLNDATSTGAAGVKDTAREEGRAVADTARTETARLASEARRELRSQSEAQTSRIATGARDLGAQLHRLAAGEGPAEGPVADLVRQAADRADALAGRLESGGVDGITADVKEFARRRPGAYLAGAFALGIVAGRMFRNADTRALVDAARPDGDGDASMMGSTGPELSTGSELWETPAPSPFGTETGGTPLGNA